MGISTSEIDALAAMVSDSNKRLDAVNRISSNASSIVASAARQLFAQQPSLISPGGNAYTSRRMAACLRETYLALGTPGASVAAGVNLMKEAALALVNDKAGISAGDCASLSSEIGTYFDKAAASVA